ncbi:hypothetical protein ACN6KF_004118 [Labrys sp. La1]|uniref:hypothetical protein n=2 Tax=unclassified Labrys (in: a-proteobacteria) TaxID=2688601 RepID=UPI003EBF477B
MSKLALRKETPVASASDHLPVPPGKGELQPAGAGMPSLAQPVSPVRPKRKPRRRFGALATFLVIVVVPTVVSALYFLAIASSQYESEFRFGVRAADMPRNDATAMFQGMASASQIGLDSYVVVQYIRSRELVDKLRAEYDFSKVFGGTETDWFSRLGQDASSEKVVEYWNKRVDPFFDLTTGSVTVQVRAFSPQDSQKLAQSILAHSETLVNELSRRSRDDAVRGATQEVSRAEERLRNVLADQRVLRDTRGTINPEKEAEGGLMAVSKLREQLAKFNADLAVQKEYMGADSPTVRATESKVRAMQAQVALAESRLTNKGAANAGPEDASRPLSADIGAFDALAAERRFAEENYKASLASLEKAREQANRQMTYLAAFVSPSLPQEALYPKRFQDILITFVAALGVWIFLIIAIRSIKEHA